LPGRSKFEIARALRATFIASDRRTSETRRLAEAEKRCGAKNEQSFLEPVQLTEAELELVAADHFISM
jgi:hypothetical protein